MARTLHESVAGIDLLIPDAYDFFDIGTGLMPNGDDCLVINQGDSRAFAPAPTMIPNLFKKAGQGPWALSFWVKTENIENSKTIYFGVQTAAATGGVASNNPLKIGITTHVAGLNSISASILCVPGNIATPTIATTGTGWQFFVFNIPAPGGTIRTYKNTDLDFTNAGTLLAGTVDYSASQYFYIGRYSDAASSPLLSMNKKYLGKIAFHDRALTLTEVKMMYYAMVGA